MRRLILFGSIEILTDVKTYFIIRNYGLTPIYFRMALGKRGNHFAFGRLMI